MEEKKINYEVSEQTAHYIKCLQQCSELFSSITDALECQYWGACTDLMERDFAPMLEKVRKKLYTYIGDSICDNVAVANPKNKI